MCTISAKELKTKGITAIEAALSGHPEVIVSVRGKDRFVVMDIDHYHYLRGNYSEVIRINSGHRPS